MPDQGADDWIFRRGSLVYPMPVAIACGRVFRARTAVDRVHASIKGGEVLARYVAAVALASFAAREDEVDVRLSDMEGDLAFGQFLTCIQEVAKLSVGHPAGPLLAQGFKKTRRNGQRIRGPTDDALVTLLGLRNDLAHVLKTLDEGHAIAIEAEHDPKATLLSALDGVDAMLAKPLFVIETQEWTTDAIVGRRLLLMGESADPAPDEISMHERGLTTTGDPYVAEPVNDNGTLYGIN